MITWLKDEDGTHVFAGGHRLAIFTTQTDDKLINRFIDLAKAKDAELSEISAEYEIKRNWNMKSNGQGKNWPVFARRDKIINELCKQAGIVDT
jgi:hypothetical protein